MILNFRNVNLGRSLILGAASALALSFTAQAGPTNFEQFESCEAAQAAVREAASSGLATHRPFFAVVFDDAQCYRGSSGGFTSFAEEREIAGQQCFIGYVCIDELPSESAG